MKRDKSEENIKKILDLINEEFKLNSKVLIFISGASSSGKSYYANKLKDKLESDSHKALIISLDQYNVGNSVYIPSLVIDKYFINLKEKKEEIIAIFKEVIYKDVFKEKFSDKNQRELKDKLSKYIDKQTIDSFISLCIQEYKNINFDDPKMYDLKTSSIDIKKALNCEDIYLKKYSKLYSERKVSDLSLKTKDYDCFIIEGIFALGDELLSYFNEYKTIKCFIKSDDFTLFVRRVLRDKEISGTGSPFTVKHYFSDVLPFYLNNILPNINNADLILDNQITFSEMREGESIIYQKEIKKESIGDLLNHSEIILKSEIKDYIFSNDVDIDNNATVTLRKEKKGTSLFFNGAKELKDDVLFYPYTNILNAEEMKTIFKDEYEVLNTFKEANLIPIYISNKIKTTLKYKSNIINLYHDLNDDKYYLESDKKSKDIL